MKNISVITFGVLLLFASCKENTQVNLISGKIFQDCNTPLAGAEIALKTNIEGSFSSPIIIGSDVTESDGTINLSYELEEDDSGTGSLLLVNAVGFETLIDNVTLNQNVSVILYRNDLSEVQVQLSGSRIYSANDTLFYGLSNSSEDFQKVAPSIGSLDTFQIQSTDLNKDDVAAVFYYGVGSDDFIKAKSNATDSDSTYQNIDILLNGCGTQTEVDLIID